MLEISRRRHRLVEAASSTLSWCGARAPRPEAHPRRPLPWVSGSHRSASSGLGANFAAAVQSDIDVDADAADAARSSLAGSSVVTPFTVSRGV